MPVNSVEIDKTRFDPTQIEQARKDQANKGEMQEDRAELADDPLSQTGTYEGKKVFSANELNQAGEDKEYFPPKDDHRFKVPQDAQHHVLKPDITLTPGTDPEIEVKERK